MRLSINNGFVVADWEGKPKTSFPSTVENENSMTEQEEAFARKLRDGNYDVGNPCVDIRLGTYKISCKPFWAYLELDWLYRNAKAYCIELDESFMRIYNDLCKEYNKIYDECWEERAQRLTALAEERWKEISQPNTSCRMCYSCKPVIDGDLYCAKYKKYLDIEVAPAYDGLSGVHMMFASHGVPLEECKEAEKQRLEKEKEKYINDAVYDGEWWEVNGAVEKIMNKGEMRYV